MTPIDRLAADYWDRYLEASPTTATIIGDRRFDHLLDDISPQATAEWLSQLRRIQAEAEGMHEDDLDHQGRITRAMLMSETLVGIDMIETGIHEFLHILFICQAACIRIQSCDLTVAFGMSDQFRQIVSQCRFAACEDDMRHAQCPQSVKDFFPLIRAEFGEVALAGIIAMGAVVVAAIRHSQIHAIGSGGMRAEWHDRVEFQFVDRLAVSVPV